MAGLVAKAMSSEGESCSVVTRVKRLKREVMKAVRRICSRWERVGESFGSGLAEGGCGGEAREGAMVVALWVSMPGILYG